MKIHLLHFAHDNLSTTIPTPLRSQFSFRIQDFGIDDSILDDGITKL